MLTPNQVQELKQKIAGHEHYWKGKPSVEYDLWRKELERDESNEAMVRRWFNDSATWVGVFENHAFDHSAFGARVAFPFDITQIEAAQLGSRAPDTKNFIGWAYVLVCKARTADEALLWLRHAEKAA